MVEDLTALSQTATATVASQQQLIDQMAAEKKLSEDAVRHHHASLLEEMQMLLNRSSEDKQVLTNEIDMLTKEGLALRRKLFGVVADYEELKEATRQAKSGNGHSQAQGPSVSNSHVAQNQVVRELDGNIVAREHVPNDTEGAEGSDAAKVPSVGVQHLSLLVRLSADISWIVRQKSCHREPAVVVLTDAAVETSPLRKSFEKVVDTLNCY